MHDGVDAFKATLGEAAPPVGIGGALEALWWVGRGDWERAHRIVAAGEGEPELDCVHALLHRVEGDVGNARYWYRRAGRPVATGSTDDEWRDLVGALLGRI